MIGLIFSDGLWYFYRLYAVKRIFSGAICDEKMLAEIWPILLEYDVTFCVIGNNGGRKKNENLPTIIIILTGFNVRKTALPISEGKASFS